MFGGVNMDKLKTSLRLAVARLKLLEKKKTELALKARKEIADYIAEGKVERAKIRVEHIIREDYIVEAMEIIEMYCDLLLARFGLLQQMNLIWVAPRLQTDVAELKIIGIQLTSKYGKPYGLACRENTVGTVSPKLMQKMSVQAPPKILVEKYLIEIARNYNVDYEPDQKILNDEEDEGMLIELGEGRNTNNLGGHNNHGNNGNDGGGNMLMGAEHARPQHPLAPPGFVGYPYMPVPAAPFQQPEAPPSYQPFNYPTVPMEEKNKMDLEGGWNFQPPGNFPGGAHFPGGGHFPGAGMNIPGAPSAKHSDTMGPHDKVLNTNNQDDSKPKPAPRSKLSPPNESFDFGDLPELPTVPSNFPSGGNTPKSKPNNPPPDDNEIDFDDLTRRFEDLKKRK